jgi:hypothetical protein
MSVSIRDCARGLGAVLAMASAHPVCAQSTQLTAGIVTGAVGCAPSNNGTGHLVCAQYSTSGAIVGVSWQTPPGAPLGPTGREPRGQIDPLPLSPAGMALVGAPACGPANDGTGTVGCLVVSSAGGNYAVSGVAFYPPTQTARSLALATVPGTARISAASCASGNTQNGSILCVLVINDQLNAIGFEARSNVNTQLQALPLGNGFVGNPSCASAQGTGNVVSVCAIRQGNGLLGFSFDINGMLTAVQSLSLGTGSFLGDPGCAIPANGKNTDGTFTATCAIVGGGVLLGISFDPQAGTLTGFQSLGAAGDGGSWNGALGCASVPDFRNAETANANLISCGAVSSKTNLFDVTFDPRGNVSRGLNGPFASGTTSKPSCVALAVDADEISCAGTTTDGASSGFRLPAGLLPAAALAPVIAVLH